MNRLTLDPRGIATAEYGDTQITDTNAVGPTVDLHDVMRTGNVPRGTNPRMIAHALDEVDKWLPFAAESYGISSNVEDFVVTPTLAFYTEIPNANLCGFPFEEMSSWNPQAANLSYRTWERKPCFREHANSDHTKAKGLIFDTSLRPAPEYLGGLYRLVLLTGWDRSRDPELASHIKNGRTGFSMGAWVERYHCSVCNANIQENGGFGCRHIGARTGPKMEQENGRLVYRVARGVTGFELSSVERPAFRQAMAVSIG